MGIVKKILRHFKIQPDIWFFYVFLVFFVLNFRKVLFTYSIEGFFNEWTGIYLYISDIFLLLAIIAWLIIILNNKLYYLSIRIFKLWLKKAYINLPLFLVGWSFISVFWSENQNIALFKAIKLLEMYFLYLFVIFRISPSIKALFLSKTENYDLDHFSAKKENKIVPRGTIAKNILGIILILGFIQAIIAIFQFILQHSLGLSWLFESQISPNINGVAKIIINGEKYIRAYGLFPHPNILGGFLLFSVITLIFLKKVFYPHSAKCSTWNIWQNRQKIFYKILPFFGFSQFIALILTFSKSAVIGFFISLIYCLRTLYYFDKNFILQKKYFLPIRKFHNCLFSSQIKQFYKIIFDYKKIAIVVSVTFLFLVVLNLKSVQFLNLEKSFSDRFFLINVSRGTIENNILLGVGMGQFVLNMQKYEEKTLEKWQFQPVHNVFLLVWSELGMIGLILFILFLFNLLRNEKKIQKNDELLFFDSNFIFKGIFIGLTVIMCLDHYLWDIQAGQCLFWLIAGMIVGLKKDR